MNKTHLFAPIAIAMGLAAAAPAQAHGGVVVGVGLPPVALDVNGVLVTIGQPPPPPPVVVYEQPREVVVVREPVYVERDYVVVHERNRPAVVYYDDDCGRRGHGHGNKHGKYKHNGKGHGHGNGHGGGHYTNVKHHGGHRR